MHPATLVYANDWSMVFLDKVLLMVKQHNEGMFISPRTLTFCLKLVGNSISISHCFNQMVNFLEKIMLEYCVPLLALNQKDEDYWVNEPIQFIYSENCKTDDHNMLKNAAEELIKKIAETRPEPKAQPFIHNLKNFVFISLETMENPLTKQKIDPLSKEYLLHALQTTTDVYKLDRLIRNDLEGFTDRHIIPELFSDSDILKYRCLALYSRIGYFFAFKNDQACLKACQGITSCMGSKLLPLKIAATEAMCALLRNPVAKTQMIGEMDRMLKIILELLNEIDYDGLIHSLETIIEIYENDIGSEAAKIIEGLGMAYYNYKGNLNANKGQPNEEENEVGESERAASACLETMANLMKNNLSQALYKDCIDPILKILNITILENDDVDFQNSMTLLNLLVYKNNEIDNTLAFYFPIVCYFIIGKSEGNLKMDISNFNEQAQEVLSKVTAKTQWFEDVGMITACMLNFFQKCGQGFLQMEDCFGVPFIELTFRVVQELIQKSLDQMHVHCLQFGVKLLNGLMENFRGQIDNHMNSILGMVDELLNLDTKSNTTINWLLSVISVAIWYNPELTFSFFNNKNSRSLEGWFESFNLMTSEQDRERKLFALTHILMVRSDSLPQFVHLGPVMNEIFKTTHMLIESKKCDIEDDGDYNDSYNSEYSDYYDDEEDEWSEDEDYEEEFDNIFYDSPLLSSSPVVELKKVLEQFEQSNNAYFMQLIQSLNKDDQQKFSGMLQEAEKIFTSNNSTPNSSKFRG